MLLELARRLAARPDPLPRRVVFIAFSGEERGLLGSRHYVDDPLFPLEQTVAMVNFDMVGRLDDNEADRLRRRQHARPEGARRAPAASSASTST